LWRFAQKGCAHGSIPFTRCRFRPCRRSVTVNQERATPSRIHGTIARAIGIEIVSGKRPPGSQFGGEIEESELRGISRTAYREAMRSLPPRG
jgi:hypothetical protein